METVHHDININNINDFNNVPGTEAPAGIQFKWTTQDYLRGIYYPALSSEYPYLCFADDDEQSGPSKFLTDPLYRDAEWYIVSSGGTDCAVVSVTRDGRAAKVNFIEVSRSMRGRGTGSAIIRAVAASPGTCTVRLMPRNAESERFYRSLGFGRSETDPCYMTLDTGEPRTP